MVAGDFEMPRKSVIFAVIKPMGYPPAVALRKMTGIMFDKLSAVAAALLCAASVPAAFGADLDINGRTYSVDTVVAKKRVGPGVTYAHYRVPMRPLNIFVLETDLSNSHVTMEVWNGGEAAVACEQPTSVNRRYSARGGIDVVAVHNGDFFTTNLGEAGISRMGLYGAGEVIFNATGNPLLVIDNDRGPWIDYVNFAGTATGAGQTLRLHTVNQLRLEWQGDTHANQLSLFTPAFGQQLHANTTGGNAAVLEPVAGSATFPANTNISMRVTEIVTGAVQTPIPRDGAVLHGVGSSGQWIATLKAGDVVDLYLGTVLPSYPDVKTVRDAIGGSGHIILRNGQLTNINNADCHPRTFMGISRDRTKLYSVVIDGRQATSAGIDLDDQGRVLQWLGAWDGINLDGGGSSCMVVNDMIRNHPSDGPERAVGNGVIFYSTAPQDDEVASLQFDGNDFKYPAGAWVEPVVQGFNKYDVLKDKDVQEWTLTATGAEVNGHRLTMPLAAGTGHMTATIAGGVSATQPFTVIEAPVQADVATLVVDNRGEYPVPLSSQTAVQAYAVDPGTVTWTVADPGVVSVEGGMLRGLDNGTTVIEGVSGHFNGTMTVATENVDGDSRAVFHGMTAAQIGLKQTGGTNLTAEPDGNGWQLNYTGNGTARGCYIQMGDASLKVRTYGLPRTLTMELNPGDAPVSQVTLNFTDNRGNRGAATLVADAPAANTLTTYTLDLGTVTDIDDNAVYPITFSGLRFVMGTSAKGQEYTISVPRVEWGYGPDTSADDITAHPAAVSDDDALYTVGGVRVQGRPAPGLYVTGGKKVRINP